MEPLQIKKSELTARQSEMWERLALGMSTHITEEDGITLFAIIQPSKDDDGPPVPAPTNPPAVALKGSGGGGYV